MANINNLHHQCKEALIFSLKNIMKFQLEMLHWHTPLKRFVS